MSGQQHVPAELCSRERPGTHFTGGWVGPRVGLDGRKISSLPGFDPRTIQPVVIRYTDWATRHTTRTVLLFKHTGTGIAFARRGGGIHLIHYDSITVHVETEAILFQSLMVTWCTRSLTFNNCTLCPPCIYVFFIYLRTNSDLDHLQHKLMDFYIRDEKCLLRSMNWGFNITVCASFLKG